MNKIIVIGESRLDITLGPDGKSGSAEAGGLLLRAACSAASSLKVMYVSEIGNDAAGDIIFNSLSEAGVDCSLIDRLASPVTPLSVSAGGKSTPYTPPGEEEGLDIAWPRIDRGDVVVFGGYFALDPRIRPRLLPLLEAARELGAKMVYVPDVADSRVSRVTRIMPQVFENLEMADMVIALDRDLQVLYSTTDGARAYADNVAFYCPSMAVVDVSGKVAVFGQAEGSSARTPADAVASILVSLIMKK